MHFAEDPSQKKPREFHAKGGEEQSLGPRRLGAARPATAPRGRNRLRLTKEERSHEPCARTVAAPENSFGFVANSRQMLAIIHLAVRVAKVDVTVLVTGDTGVGKERVARLVHDESARATGPFLAVNCAAITEALLESELFGHVRGAFTGATSDHQGLFEAACGGTLLLDEVGEMTPSLQGKLLRVLQEREIRRVGETKCRPVNVRILAATNRDLTLAMDEGTFRRDLFYRLNVVELRVPALKERPEDILPLARVLLADAAVSMARRITGLSPSAERQIRHYDWPGNVRELENAMERGVALAPGECIEVEDLPEEVRRANGVPVAEPVGTAGAVKTLAEAERDHILAVLRLSEGNRAHAAEQLSIGLTTLYRKLRLWDADASVSETRSSQ